MRPLKETGVFAIFIVVLAAFGCSTDEPSGCTTDLDCKGDRICSAGRCIDEGDAAQSERGDAAVTSEDKPASVEGKECSLSGSDCDPDCLSSCGSPTCVDLCCSDSSSTGVMCDGQCREPKCTEGTDTVVDGDERPWLCSEMDGDCACSNASTEEELMDNGAKIVPNCPGESCAFDYDGGDWHCQCNVDEPPEEVEITRGVGDGPIADCSTRPVARCVGPCEGMVLVK
jgi:hypothetical protein